MLPVLHLSIYQEIDEPSYLYPDRQMTYMVLLACSTFLFRFVSFSFVPLFLPFVFD